MSRFDPSTDMLGLIDVQPTFMPGGKLPVEDGDAVVPLINRLLGRGWLAFATQDWHPSGHSSFASAHPGHRAYDRIAMPYGEQVLWPDHAVAGTDEAGLHPDLDQRRIALVLRKGMNPALDSYSAFFENDHATSTGLHGWLREGGARRLFLCGLATDFCVAWSAEDAARLGYEVAVVEDACRGIGLPVVGGGTTIDEARRRVEALGVRFVRSDAIA
jgi:nicotinamidase/pyrazinamidase